MSERAAEIDTLRHALYDLTEKWLQDGTGEDGADDLYTVDTCAQQVRAVVFPPSILTQSAVPLEPDPSAAAVRGEGLL
jgi:hypothetical protein